MSVQNYVNQFSCYQTTLSTFTGTIGVDDGSEKWISKSAQRLEGSAAVAEGDDNNPDIPKASNVTNLSNA